MEHKGNKISSKRKGLPLNSPNMLIHSKDNNCAIKCKVWGKKNVTDYKKPMSCFSSQRPHRKEITNTCNLKDEPINKDARAHVHQLRRLRMSFSCSADLSKCHHLLHRSFSQISWEWQNNDSFLPSPAYSTLVQWQSVLRTPLKQQHTHFFIYLENATEVPCSKKRSSFENITLLFFVSLYDQGAFSLLSFFQGSVLYTQPKCDSNIFLAETVAICILDYTLYSQE